MPDYKKLADTFELIRLARAAKALRHPPPSPPSARVPLPAILERGEKGEPGSRGDPGLNGTGRVQVSESDPTPEFLAEKLIAGDRIKLQRRTNASGEERLVIEADLQQVVDNGYPGPRGMPGLDGLPGPAGADGPAGLDGPAGATGPAGADAPSTLDVHLQGWDGTQWINVLGDSTGRLVVTS